MYLAAASVPSECVQEEATVLEKVFIDPSIEFSLEMIQNQNQTPNGDEHTLVLALQCPRMCPCAVCCPVLPAAVWPAECLAA